MTLEEQIKIAEKNLENLKAQRKNKVFRYSRDGKNYKVNLPQKVRFVRTTDILGLIKPEEFKVVGFKTPQKEEYYLSGADVTAYLAPNDLLTKYIVVKRVVNV